MNKKLVGEIVRVDFVHGITYLKVLGISNDKLFPYRCMVLYSEYLLYKQLIGDNEHGKGNWTFDDDCYTVIKEKNLKKHIVMDAL